MKKISLIIIAALGLSFAANAQIATLAEQQTQTATLTLIKKKADTTNQYLRAFPSLTGQTAANATLVAIKKSSDTTNQYLRLAPTLVGQTAANATLVALKKSSDTTNQYLRLAPTLVGQTAANATLVAIKKGTDTTNQYLRFVQPQKKGVDTLNQTNRSIKKKLDTLNQYTRAFKLVLDSINQNAKLKVVSASLSSTNAATNYSAAGVVIQGTANTGFSVSVGTGNWEITKVIMYPSTASSTLDVNLSIFSNTVATGADNVILDISASIGARYAGTFWLGQRTPFTSRPIYQSKEGGSGTQIGDKTVNVVPGTTGVIYCIAWANTSFTPPTTEVYNFVFYLKRLN